MKYNEEMAKDEAKREWELIYEKGEFDAMEIGFFFNPQYQGSLFGQIHAYTEYQKVNGEVACENSSFIRYTWELHGIAEMFGTCRSTKY